MVLYQPKSLLDKVFEGGIILKGLSGLLEFLSGLLLFFVSPASLHDFISFLTQKELLSDPHDVFANFLVHSTQSIGSGSQTFLIVYLWIHAAIKLIAVIGILKNQLWAYPFSLIALGVLMLYQVYSIVFVKLSIGMTLLTVFDVLILWLIWHEYGKFKAKLATT
ncbi:MAG: DUF2127 domain-containing protein [Candidatus Saccharibacteria bacterium]